MFTYTIWEQHVDELKTGGGYINYQSDIFGMDSIEECRSKSLFKNFPYPVSYRFNSLGYRDRNISEYIKNPIITVGDSFTVGLGLPADLIYPVQLEKLVNHQVLNFSMNGASNDWMARKLELILKYFSPIAIIVHYTFSARRELDRPDWFDNERVQCEPIYTEEENYNNWLTNHNKIQTLTASIPTWYSFLPQWHTDPNVVDHIENQIKFEQIDQARDGFHYGAKTCLNLAHLYADRIRLL